MGKGLLEIIRSKEDLSRRDFIDLGKKAAGDASKSVIAYNAAKLGLSVEAFLCTLGCVAQRKANIQQSLDEDNYRKSTNDWDPIFGPPILRGKYGYNDFKGHVSHGFRGAVDYDVPNGTLLVPAMSGCLYKFDEWDIGGNVTMLASYTNPYYRTAFLHLSGNIIDERYYHGSKDTQRLIERNEIVSLSGNSGRGPYNGFQRPHLHFELNFWDRVNRIMDQIDPEKYGPDGGKPIFWDGETDLDMDFYKRVEALEKTIKNLDGELKSWPKGEHDLEQLGGNLGTYGGYLKDADWAAILDSKHFHDMRELLKREILGKSKETKHIPGTKPYSLMVKILGYSADQDVVLTLPFISPELVSRYKEPVYKQGEFVPVRSWQGGK
ncbi:MAG: hypothetical protein JRL30_26650 [Deltaproteobacteria bacterium]|nr:hypothetical protein [Deltaproteobacteria bacterium]